MPTLQIEVQKDILNRLDSLARNQECPTNQVVADALAKYLEWYDHQMTMWQGTEEAISQADEGDVIPGDEVFSWLDTWGKPQTKR